MYYLRTETQEKYFEDVIRLHKSGCSNGAISRLLPVSKTTVPKWISIFVREKGQIMRVKRTEKLVDPDSHLRELHAVLQAIHCQILISRCAILGSRDEFGNCMRFPNLLRNSVLRIGLQFSVAEKLLGIAGCFAGHS